MRETFALQLQWSLKCLGLCLAGVAAPLVTAFAQSPTGLTAGSACHALPTPALVWAQAQQRLADCNRDLQVAQRTALAARTEIVTAGQRPNPTLSTGVGQYAPAIGYGSGNLLDKQVDWLARIDQTIERGNKRGLRIESAELNARAVQWSVADVLRQQQLALALAWIDLWGAQERVRLQRELTALYHRTLDGARTRLKAGDIAAADVSRIELDVQRAEGDRIAANTELARSRSIVAALLAMEPQAMQMHAQEPWPRLAEATLTGIDPTGAERPDLQAARAQEAAAQARVRLAQSLGTRDVSVGVQLDRYAPPSGYGWLYGVYLSFPLFINHRYEGEMARAQADLDTAMIERMRLEQAALGAQQRLAEARGLYRLRRERIEREALPLAEKVAANADLAYRKGAGTVLELLDALRQLRALQLEALTARLDEDRSDAAARAEMLTAGAAADPIFGESLRGASLPHRAPNP
jgi:outer membrane protein, heavy metal efflux system